MRQYCGVAVCLTLFPCGCKRADAVISALAALAFANPIARASSVDLQSHSNTDAQVSFAIVSASALRLVGGWSFAPTLTRLPRHVFISAEGILALKNELQGLHTYIRAHPDEAEGRCRHKVALAVVSEKDNDVLLDLSLVQATALLEALLTWKDLKDLQSLFQGVELSWASQISSVNRQLTTTLSSYSGSGDCLFVNDCPSPTSLSLNELTEGYGSERHRNGVVNASFCHLGLALILKRNDNPAGILLAVPTAFTTEYHSALPGPDSLHDRAVEQRGTRDVESVGGLFQYAKFHYVFYWMTQDAVLIGSCDTPEGTASAQSSIETALLRVHSWFFATTPTSCTVHAPGIGPTDVPRLLDEVEFQITQERASESTGTGASQRWLRSIASELSVQPVE